MLDPKIRVIALQFYSMMGGSCMENMFIDKRVKHSRKEIYVFVACAENQVTSPKKNCHEWTEKMGIMK